MTGTTCKIAEHHIFERKGVTFLYDVHSMNLYEISQRCREIIERIDSPETCPGDDYDEIIDALKEAKILRTDDDAAEEPAPQKPADNEDDQQITIRNIILELANDCNLNCKYCYGDGGSYGRKREIMSPETAKKAVDYLVEHSGKAEYLTIVFFGGEPLLNFRVMKAVVEYCREISEKTKKHFGFSITTNGTILNDEILSFFKENKFTITLSIDGPQSIQDCYRCYVSGKGSYDTLRPNVKKLVDMNGGRMLARATVCHPNLQLYDIFKSLSELEFKSVALSLVDARKDSELYIKDEDFPVLINEIDKIADDYVEAVKAGKQHSYFLLDSIITDIYRKCNKLVACGAGRGTVAVGTDGNFYPCQRFMGMEDYVLGDLEKGLIANEINEFREIDVENIEGCQNCWARYLCGGGCPHTAAKANDTIHKAPEHFCSYYREINEIGLYTYWRLKEFDEDIFRKRFENHQNDKTENALV